MNGKKPVTETKKISDARTELGSLVDRVKRKESRILIERNGVPVAAIVSTRDLEQLDLLEEKRQRAYEAFMAVGEKFADVPVEELERQVGLALAEVRAERRARREKPPARTA